MMEPKDLAPFQQARKQLEQEIESMIDDFESTTKTSVNSISVAHPEDGLKVTVKTDIGRLFEDYDLRQTELDMEEYDPKQIEPEMEE